MPQSHRPSPLTWFKEVRFASCLEETAARTSQIPCESGASSAKHPAPKAALPSAPFRSFALLWTASLAVGLAGCPDPPNYGAFNHAAPLAISAGVVLANSGAKKLDVLGAASAEVTVRHLEHPHADSQRIVTADGKRAVMLDSTGRVLTVTDGVATKPIALPTEFAGLASSDDGLVVALWHPQQGSLGTTLVNSDEVALVDLDKPPGKGNPTLATLPSLGKAPLRARVTVPVDAADGKHRILWAETQGRIGIADFTPAGTVRTLTIPLSAQTQSAIAPVRTLVRAAAGKVDLYLVASGLNDVVHIAIDLSGAQLAATLDQVAAGANPVDLHLFDPKEGLRALTANFGSKALGLLDPSTGTGLEIPLAVPLSRFVPVLGNDGKQRLFGWYAGAGVAAGYVVDLDDLPKKKGKALRRLDFSAGVSHVTVAGHLLLVQLASGAAPLALVNPQTGNVTEFQGTGKILGVLATASAGVPTAYVLGQPTSGLRLSRIDLSTLAGVTANVDLSGAHTLVPLGATGVAVLGGGGNWGAWVLAAPQGDLETAKLRFLEGFALDDLLQAEAP